jgi:hypothetical protein
MIPRDEIEQVIATLAAWEADARRRRGNVRTVNVNELASLRRLLVPGSRDVSPTENIQDYADDVLRRRSRAVPPPIGGTNMLTVEDIAQIVEGIENFIMCGDPAVDALWQPYVDKLNALKAETRSVPPTTVGGNETIIDEDGIYQSRPPRPFAALRAKMPPESQVRAAARTEEMLSEIRTAETRAVIPEPMRLDNLTQNCPTCGGWGKVDTDTAPSQETAEKDQD